MSITILNSPLLIIYSAFEISIFFCDKFLRLYTIFCPNFVLRDRKSTRLNSSHVSISYAVFCLKKINELPSARALISYGGRLAHPYRPPRRCAGSLCSAAHPAVLRSQPMVTDEEVINRCTAEAR